MEPNAPPNDTEVDRSGDRGGLPFPNLPKWQRYLIVAALIASVTIVPMAIYVGLTIAELRGWEPPVWGLKGVGW